MKKSNVCIFSFVLFIIVGLTSCSYPDSYIYDLCQSQAPKEDFMDLSEKHKNFYDMVVFKGRDGTDPLYAAVTKYQDKDLADFFITNGADIDTEYLKRSITFDTLELDFSFATVLHMAIVMGNYDLVKFLLDNNANVNKATKISFYNDGNLTYTMDYITPYQLALVRGNADVISLIRNHESFKDTPCYFLVPGYKVETCSTEMLEEIIGSILSAK